MTDFVTKFYHLEGELISERKKNLFKLLKAQPVPLKEDDLKDLCPRTYLERLFEIDTFIYFNMSMKILDIIKKGNKKFVTKILKRPMILREAIANMPPETFVNEFLPCTSYPTRMKILKKIAPLINESQMDEIIFWVQKRYGFNIATKILHTCSSTKIQDFLVNQDVLLKPKQIKVIFNKDPDLLSIYLKHYKISTGNAYCHKNLSKYIALKNPKTWLELQKEEIFNFVTLGYRTSKSFIRHNNNEFLENVKYYSDFLRIDVVVQELRENFNEVYFEFFPQNINDISVNNFSHKLLRHYPKKKQWDLFAQTFTRVFKSNILDNLIYLNFGFIQMFANNTIKNRWAEVQYNENKSIYVLKYYNPNKAISLVKEKMLVSDNNAKTELILLLLENCAENEDLMALNSVLKFIYSEYLSICINIDYLCDAASQVLNKIVFLFKLENLDKNHWSCINEIITLLKPKMLQHYYQFTDIFIFMIKYIEFLCIQKKSFRKELITFSNEVDSNCNWFHIYLKNPKVEKQIWTEFINILYPDAIQIDSKSFKISQENFINNVIDFNENNPDYSIDLSNFPNLIKYIKGIFNQDVKSLEYGERDILKKVINYNLKFPKKPIIMVDKEKVLEIFQENKRDFSFGDAMERAITKKNRSNFENELLEIFWDNVNDYSQLNRRVIYWFFINEPKTVVPHFQRLLKIDKKFIDIEYVKLMSHLNFDKEVINDCMNKLGINENFSKNADEEEVVNELSDEDNNILKKQIDLNINTEIIKILSTLLSTKEYIDIVVKPFTSNTEKVETDLDNTLNEMKLWEIVKSLGKLEEPEIVLPTLIKFCLGDYFKPSLPSLYNICYRLPEENLYSCVDLLFDGTVSTRKHALYLSCELLNMNYVLQKLRNNDSDVCYKRYVFIAILKYFRKNPSEELLNLVLSNINHIDTSDEKILGNLAKFNIPIKYIGQYIQNCWYFFESIRNQGSRVQNYLQSFLDAIICSNNILMSLAVDFCLHIITNYFKDVPEIDYKLENIHCFVCMVLRNQTSDDNFKIVFDIISIFKNIKSTECITIFFNSFYDIAIQDIEINNKIDSYNNYHIELFKQYWYNIFSPIEMFDEYVLINLLYLRCKSSDNLIENYAQEVVIYLEQLVHEYGPYIYYKFKNLLLKKHSFSKKETYLFFYNVLKYRNSTLNCILVLDLLERCYPHDDSKEIYHKIIDMLKESNDPIVSIYFKSYFAEEA